MTEAEYEAVKASVCPYCRAKLPSALTSMSNDSVWTHSIPRTPHVFPCIASDFRCDGNWIDEKQEIDSD